MRVEVRKVMYTPDQYNDEGELKKEAFFELKINITNSPEVREMLSDVLLLGESEFAMEMLPVQATIPEVKEQIQELKDAGVTEVRRE